MPGMKRRDFFKLLAAAPVAAAAAPAIAAAVTQGIPAPVMQIQDLSNIWAAQAEYIHRSLPRMFARFPMVVNNTIPKNSIYFFNPDDFRYPCPIPSAAIVNIQPPNYEEDDE